MSKPEPIDGVALIQWLGQLANNLSTEAGLDEKLAGREEMVLAAFEAGTSPDDEGLLGAIPYLGHDWRLDRSPPFGTIIRHICSQCGESDAEDYSHLCTVKWCSCQGGYYQPEGVALRANDCPVHGLEDDPDYED